MNKMLSRFISGALALTLSFSLGVPAFAANPVDQAPSYTETITDDNGNSYNLVYDAESNDPLSDTHAALYDSNGTLLQETYVYPADDRVVEYCYTTSTSRSAPNVTEYSYSSLISSVSVTEAPSNNEQIAIDEDAPQYNANVPFPVFNDDDWALVNHWPAASASPYPINLYSMNYDEEPDSNRFERKTLSLPAKIAITTAAGILGGFITTGGITLAIVVRAFGAAIVTQGTQQVINKAIKGSVCYSTQKILYAPVVEGYNIYPGAYITKLWLVAENALENKTTISLAQSAYEYSPQPSEEDLMFAARHYFTDWAQQNGYN